MLGLSFWPVRVRRVGVNPIANRLRKPHPRIRRPSPPAFIGLVDVQALYGSTAAISAMALKGRTHVFGLQAVVGLGDGHPLK